MSLHPPDCDLEILPQLWLSLAFFSLCLPEQTFLSSRRGTGRYLPSGKSPQQSSLSLLNVSQSEAGIVAEISFLP